MRIITNADDFGEDADIVRATIECFENGSLTSATITPNMPATQAALDYARANPRFSFGVHLTYVLGAGTERPISDHAGLSTLCSPDGLFRPSNATRMDAVRGRLDPDQIARETRAQLARVRDAGVPIDHVDSHGHLHRYGVFVRVLERVLPEFAIRRVRGAQNVYLRKPLKSPNFWLGPIWARAIRRRFVTTAHFYMPTSAKDRDWGAALLDRAPRLARRGETIEVGVHPGYAEDWRDAERTDVTAFATEARRRGHELVGWNRIG